MTLAQRSLFEQTLAGSAGSHLWQVLRLVFVFTFAAEAAGAFFLFVRWLPEMGAGRALWQAVFHSVSAFCNAGFALRPDSLTVWRGDPWVVLIIFALFPEREAAARLAHRLTSPNVIDYIPLGRDSSIHEVTPPESFIGRSLGELKLRNRFKVQVLAIRDMETREVQINPDAGVALGRNQDLARLKQG